MDHRTTSTLLDCCIILLDHPIPWIVAMVVRWYKRRLEKDIPVYRGRTL